MVRALLYMARPATYKLENIPNSKLYHDVEQYLGTTVIPGFLVLQIGSAIYFANANYMKERILRWVQDENELAITSEYNVEFVLLDFGAVTAINTIRVESLHEVQRKLKCKGMKVIIIKPRIDVMDKLIVTKFIDKIGKDVVF
ncbi:UNVERIFIED_CONTAM: putative sulfate transporter 3.5 [Sesamum radiatum]|uniref:Sulfate transporter 3.5 n=1 Tax=Sesamum radiatum TaxID=300843 RepID=A0AAW2NRU9_SESRA